MTLVEKLDRLPPCLIRIMAKKNGRLMTDPELMELTGWGRSKLRAVYQSATWSNVRAGDIDRFLKACGMSWSKQRTQRWLLKRAIEKGGVETMGHLKRDTGWRGRQFDIHTDRIEELLSRLPNESKP